MIKVAYLASVMDNRGGAERVNFQVLTRLDRAQFQPSAIFVKRAGEFGRQLCDYGVQVHELGGKTRTQFFGLLQATLHHLRKSPVDILFTGEDRICMTLAALAKRLRIVPRYILCFHNTRPPWGIGKILHPFSVRSADAFMLLSQCNLQFWRRHYSMPDGKVYIIPNGIPLDDVGPLPADERVQRRCAYGLQPEGFLVGLVTFFKEFKNLPGFVEVARRVIDAGVSAQFVLAGDGPDRPRVEAAIDRLQMRSYIVLPGAVPNARDWYPLFDVALMTSSSSEAFPLTLIEAMAAGLPVVATDVAGIPDIVAHGETGFLAPPTELDKLAQYVVQLARDPELRQRMGSAGRQRALAEFDVKVMVERYAQMFKEVAGRM